MSEQQEATPYDALPRYQPGMVLTVHDVMAMVDAAIVDKGGEYVYITADGMDSCAYLDPAEIYYDEEDGSIEGPTTENFTPGCIFGHALVAMGAPVDTLLSCNNEPIDQLLIKLDIAADVETQGYACNVQSGQDKGDPWGMAKRSGDEWLAESQSD